MLRPADEGAGAAPPLDQVGLCELRQRLVHRHARAAVTRDQFVLERNAMARRPFAGQDALLDIGADTLIERRLSARRWRGSCDEPPHCCVEAFARGLTQSVSAAFDDLVAAGPDAIDRAAACRQRSSRRCTASRARPASDGCAVSSVTMSARAPGAEANRRLRQRPRAARERMLEQRASRRAAGTGRSTLRSRCLSRWPYSSWRSSSAAPTSTLESVPTPNAPPASRNSRAGKMPSPRLASVIGQRPATAPVFGECAYFRHPSCGSRG